MTQSGIGVGPASRVTYKQTDWREWFYELEWDPDGDDDEGWTHVGGPFSSREQAILALRCLYDEPECVAVQKLGNERQTLRSDLAYTSEVAGITVYLDPAFDYVDGYGPLNAYGLTIEGQHGKQERYSRERVDRSPLLAALRAFVWEPWTARQAEVDLLNNEIFKLRGALHEKERELASLTLEQLGAMPKLDELHAIDCDMDEDCTCGGGL